MSRILLTAAVVIPMLHSLADDARAQVMVRTETPLQNNSERFFESTSMGWSVRRPGFFASFGTSPVLPPFGGFNPNAGLTTGFSVRTGKWSSNFNFNFSQGISRSSTTIAPTVMSMNGQPASLFSGTVRPFVLGVVPVGGGFGGGFGNNFGGGFFSVPRGVIVPQAGGDSLTQRLRERRSQLAIANGSSPDRDRVSRTDKPERVEPPAPQTSQQRSSAAHAFFGNRTGRVSASGTSTTSRSSGTVGVASETDTHDQQTAELYYRRGLKAESQSNATLARIYYRQALGRATGSLKRRIQQRLNALSVR